MSECVFKRRDMTYPSHHYSSHTEVLLQGLPNNDQARDHQECRNIVGPQPRFRPEEAVVLPDISVCQIVVEEVPEYLTHCYSNHGGEVQTSDSKRSVAISTGYNGRFEQDGASDVDSDSPHEAKRATSPVSSSRIPHAPYLLVHHHRDDDRLEQHLRQSLARAADCQHVAAVPYLPDTDKSRQPCTPRGLLIRLDISSVPALIRKCYDEYQVQTADGKDDPEYRPPLASTVDDKVPEERTTVGCTKE